MERSDIERFKKSEDLAFKPMSKLDWIDEEAIIIKSDEDETLFITRNPKDIGWDYNRVPTKKIKWAKERTIFKNENVELKAENKQLMEMLHELKCNFDEIKLSKSKRRCDLDD